MSELLIELLSEEIPAGMQVKAEEAYLHIFQKYLQENSIQYSSIMTYSGPRRITIHVDNIDDIIPPATIEIKGPKINAPHVAIEKFCQSHGVDQSSLQVQKIKDQEYYICIKEQPEQTVETLLLDIIPRAIAEYVWPKSMHWGDYSIKWVRPLHNILCIYNGKLLPIKYGHLQGNQHTYGHRFLGNQQIKIENFQEYHKILAENHVILSRSDRIAHISQGLEANANRLGLKLNDNSQLLEEVAGLVEYPMVLVGKIEDKFLRMPNEILIESMRCHQKYFTLFDKDGNFAPYFLFVTNIKPNHEDAASIIQGNEKVLSARLEDALYFYNQDAKISLEARRNDLKKVIFHAKLGSLYDKTERIVNICSYIKQDDVSLKKAAMVCKSDILSEAVGEFANLQGVMGYYYAKNEGMSDHIAIAIRDHYKPLGPLDETPTDIAAILALSDKLDSICGLMLAGERATGSKDPYALRRMALGIVRIIIDNHMQIDLNDIIAFTISQYRSSKSSLDITESLHKEIITFIEERMKFYLKNQYDISLIHSVLNLEIQADIYQTYRKLHAIADFYNSLAAKELITSYKRAYNILEKSNYDGVLNPDLFESKYEKNLYDSCKVNEQKIIDAMHQGDYRNCLDILSSMESVIANFFEHVMVQTDNKQLANNRLLILSHVVSLFSKIAQFEKIV